MSGPARGEVWTVQSDPIRGHEQAGTRPALIVSVDEFNEGPAGLVVILPITSKSKGIASHVEVRPPEAGLRMPSWIMCEDIRSVSKQRLGRKSGTVTSQTLEAVEDHLRILLSL